MPARALRSPAPSPKHWTLAIGCVLLLLAGPALAQPAFRVLPGGISAVEMSNDGQVVVGNGGGGIVWTPSGGVEGLLPYDPEIDDLFQFQDVSADGGVAIVHSIWGTVGYYDLNARVKLAGGGSEVSYSRLSADGTWGLRNSYGGGPPGGGYVYHLGDPSALFLPRPVAAGPSDPFWDGNGFLGDDLSAHAELVVGTVLMPSGPFGTLAAYWTPTGGSQLVASDIRAGRTATNDLGTVMAFGGSGSPTGSLDSLYRWTESSGLELVEGRAPPWPSSTWWTTDGSWAIATAWPASGMAPETSPP